MAFNVKKKPKQVYGAQDEKYYYQHMMSVIIKYDHNSQVEALYVLYIYI